MLSREWGEPLAPKLAVKRWQLVNAGAEYEKRVAGEFRRRSDARAILQVIGDAGPREAGRVAIDRERHGECGILYAKADGPTG